MDDLIGLLGRCRIVEIDKGMTIDLLVKIGKSFRTFFIANSFLGTKLHFLPYCPESLVRQGFIA